MQKEESQHGCNTLTVTKQKLKLYQWSSNLTTEQQEEKFSWSLDAMALKNRLSNLRGCFIAVIGLQGSGKTALKQALSQTLWNEDKKVIAVKWTKNCLKGIMEKDAESGLGDDIHRSLIFTKLLQRYDKGDQLSTLAHICDKVGLRTNFAYDLLRWYGGFPKGYSEQDKKRVSHEISDAWPAFKKLLSKEERATYDRDIALDTVQAAHTILIDLPDYSRQNINQLSKDLAAIGEFWEEYILFDMDSMYSQRPNIVVFFQKELFKGHFLLGKMDTFEIKPLAPGQFVEIMGVQTGTIKPFTKETLLHLGGLSRGIFRRFKKYVRICLEKSMQHNRDEITLAMAKEWITLEQLEKDMELELQTIFPRQKELRKASVKLLQLCREKGEMLQSEITDLVFSGHKMKCSRVLEKLEAWNYIEREWVSTGEASAKKVKLKGVEEEP